MIIYTNGDSFTAGDGLIDSVFWDDYPGVVPVDNNSEDNTRKNNEWNSNKFKSIMNDKKLAKELVSSYKLQTKQLAWPAKLGSLLNAQVINNASGGSGIVGIGMSTMQDIINLVQQGNTPDYVFIGLTGSSRLSLVDNKVWWDDQKWLVTAHPGHPEEIPQRYVKYATGFWESHTDDEILLSFLYNCLSIRNFVKVHTGKFPIFVKTTQEFGDWCKIVESTNIEMVKQLWQLLEFDQLANEPSIFTVKQITHLLACGHVMEDSHNAFASYLKDRYCY